MEIETKTASLETFSVTVRALHVNGKQMTLAVFRQLPIRKEKPDDEKWGVVRYAIKDQGDVWLVFSGDGRLYRRALELQPDAETRKWHSATRRELERAQKDYGGRCPPPPDAEDWKKNNYKVGQDKLKRLTDEYMEAKDFWEDELKAAGAERHLLDTLPQLFIAV